MERELFVSYSHKDKEFAFRLAQDLADRGVGVWIDRGSIVAGEQWQDSIVGGIRHCKAFVLIVSPNALDSHMVIQEVGLALAQRKPIIPLFYKETQISSTLETQLAQFQALDFCQGGYGENLSVLLTGLSRHGIERDGASAEEDDRTAGPLGGSRATNWWAVWRNLPAWALLWVVGWTLFWTVLQLLFLLLNLFPPEDLRWLLVSGIGGALVGALSAGAISTFTLRRYADGMKWRHLLSSLRIRDVVLVELGVILVAILLYWGLSESSSNGCSLWRACLNEPIAMLTAIIDVPVWLLAFSGALSIGVLAAVLVVRRLRELEPGISQRAILWLISGWGLSAIVAEISSFLLIAFGSS